MLRRKTRAGNHDPGRHFRMLRQCAIVLPMTDFASDHSLTHLSAPEARLSGVLSHPRRIAFGCVAALTAARLACARADVGGSPLNWQALCQHWRGWRAAPDLARDRADVDGDDARDDAADCGTDDPDLCRDRRHGGAKREPVVSPLMLTAGYVAVWLGFAMLPRACNSRWSAAPGLSMAAALGGSPAGRICLSVPDSINSPRSSRLASRYASAHFRSSLQTGPRKQSGVLRLGLRQGMLCLGCCWAMMLD